MDDDEFIMDDEPIQKPPQMRDLSLLVEQVPKGDKNNKNNKHYNSNINNQHSSNTSKPTEEVMDDDEFDFL